MINNAQIWSHADVEYLVPTATRTKVSAQKITYQRISIAAVFNGEKTLFGVSVQHPEDENKKEIGQEYAMQNALMKPVMVINKAVPLKEYQFHRLAKALYSLYEEGVEPVALEACTQEEAYGIKTDIDFEEELEF